VDDNTKTQLEAAAFRRLIHHLQTHSEVQKVDLDYEQAREIIYGMPYNDWQAQHQTEATPEQLAAVEAKINSKS
jgi:uncharacterized protein